MNQKFQFMILTLANDHFIVWPSNVTLTFKLPEQMFQMNNCAKLYWNPCINVEVMARTSSIFYHFIICQPSNVALTFNLHEQMFLMNNCVKLFWNTCLNVEVTAQTSSSYDHFIIWPSSVTWPSTYLNRRFKWTTMPNFFKIHAYMY